MKGADMIGHKRHYTSGEFTRKANVTIRTIRYYDKQGTLKPSQMNEAGYRLYTDEDSGRLQKTLSLEYLGFSLEETMAITINDEVEDIAHLLDPQKELTEKRICYLRMMAQTLDDTARMLGESRHVDWNSILNLIHITNMEHALVNQYKTAVNLDVRIGFHRRFSHNPVSWFPWLLSQVELEMTDSILEVGCGNGELWQEAEFDSLRGKNIFLTDTSAGMVGGALELLKDVDARQEVLRYAVADCQKLSYGDASLDRVIANHVLSYVRNPDRALEEVNRVMREDDVLYCSAYGREHMKEITSLVQEFDSRIMLSEVALYELLDLENGQEMLEEHLDSAEKVLYDDYLTMDEAKLLLDCTLSCHGDQGEILSQHQLDFKSFLQKGMREHDCIHITKMAGIFICRKCAQSQ